MEYQSVWDALHEPSEASFMKMKSELLMMFQKMEKDKNQVLRCPTAEFRSLITRGRISKISFEELVELADINGMELEFSVKVK